MAAVLGFFMASVAFAQTDAPTSPPKPNSKVSNSNAKMYHCPKCGAASDKAGTCSACKVKMVKQGDYYCPGCYAQSTKAGKCAKCNKDMKQMTASK